MLDELIFSHSLPSHRLLGCTVFSLTHAAHIRIRDEIEIDVRGICAGSSTGTAGAMVLFLPLLVVVCVALSMPARTKASLAIGLNTSDRPTEPSYISAAAFL